MGKVKQMMMDQEVEFWDKALSTMLESETRNEFVSKMMPHFHLIRPMSDQDIMGQLSDGWDDHQSNYAEQNYDV